ncbi:MAG: 2-oxo acid dehydrogenase subunit E2 [Fimbriimonadales bacterium]|nr:2-oxo acid dehydrogenase subunit E2 [Fimbriimonadales bacterium]
MQEVIMPKMGDGMEEGTLVEWLKREGDKVKSGDVIGTIQTDKATLELEAPASGILTGFLIGPGDTVPVGRPIAAILKAGESLPEGWGGGPSAGRAAEESKASAPQAAAVAEVPAVPDSSRIKASPLARKIAAEAGLDLSSVIGTGPGGRIVEKDVRAALAAGPKLPKPTVEPAVVPVIAEDQVVKLTRLRQITAQRTAQSKQQAPHFYVTVAVDVEAIQALRRQFEAEGSGKVSINDFVIRACALALRDLPEANASFQGDSVVRHGAVNIGMAVAVPDGLTVPVIKNADRLTLRQISAQARELAAKARENKLTPDELTGSTFSISNMGMLDVDEFGAIINTPNAAILAVATARKTVVVNEKDEIEIRERMNITLSCDHRVLDGADGARFVNKVKEYLQNPTRLLS